MPRALIPFADGCEEIELVVIIDVLRRAGWVVVAAAINGSPVTCSRLVRVMPDANWNEVDAGSFDLLILPGGGAGTEALRADSRILKTIQSFFHQGKIIAAICAGPLVLQSAGILDGRRVTCHPSVADQLTVTDRLENRVVMDGGLVTSQGPGTSFEFALALVTRIQGQEKADEIARAMVIG